MKFSQELIIGIAIGAVGAFVLAKMAAPSAPVLPTQPPPPTRKNLPTQPPVLLRGQRIGKRPWPQRLSLHA